eukprot:scaffold956_cov533-Prasinococcus_capsulatus_cf.AAC.5
MAAPAFLQQPPVHRVCFQRRTASGRGGGAPRLLRSVSCRRSSFAFFAKPLAGSTALVRAGFKSARKPSLVKVHASATESTAVPVNPAADGTPALKKTKLVPIFQRIFSDSMTPTLAYRCLVSQDDREAPSFMLESVVEGKQAGRYSFIGSQPVIEVVAKQNTVQLLNHEEGTTKELQVADPLALIESMSNEWDIAEEPGLPEAFCGGWVGYTGYDTVRYVEKEKLPFSHAPPDDRNLPDMHMGIYHDVVIIDQAQKLVFVVHWVKVEEGQSVDEAKQMGMRKLERVVATLQAPPFDRLRPARVDLDTTKRGVHETQSNMGKHGFLEAVEKAKEHIFAGDAFQIVLSHRFTRKTFADPFEIYRALRVVNPSPYMIYLQARGCIMVASSPEILCRVSDGRVVNRPLAGTRKRGSTPAEDAALEENLLSDTKECAEHVMLVDLGRNDVGRVASAGSVKVEKLMEVERYSHVMHISSTVTGQLEEPLTSWDALRSALPAGTVSGAPKVRAMEIIDNLEVARRGPYGGGIGFISFQRNMDMALALRTMVIPTQEQNYLYSSNRGNSHSSRRRQWTVHLQAGAGVVADSCPEAEYEETVNKAAALGRAIDLAEQAFVLPEEES